MGIRSISSASAFNGVKRSKLWDQVSPLGDYEPIASIYVGHGAASSIEFTSIPGTYKHLELRGIVAQESGSNSDGYFRTDINGTVFSSYRHLLMGNGSTVTSYSDSAGGNFISTALTSSDNGIFCAFILRILDYANTSINKTMYSISGFGPGTYGKIMHSTSLFPSTSAITSIKFNNTNGNFRRYSHVALYGIKG